MTNQTVINTINSVCKTNPYLAQPYEVFQAALHSFYFMRPSNKRDEFVAGLEFLFTDTLEEARTLKASSEMSMRDCMLHVATKHLLIQLTENFDKDYFKTQIENLDLNAEYDKELVSNCIRTFNKEKLFNYFALVGGQNFNGGHFITNEAFCDMWNDLNEECIKIDPSVPNLYRYRSVDDDLEIDFDERRRFDFVCPETGEVTTKEVDTLYFFDYLPTDTIVRIFEKHVDGNMEMLAFLTTAFCSTDYKTAMCLTFAMCHYLSNYSLYSFDTRKVNPHFDISDSYLDFCVEMAEASRSNKR